MKKIEICLSLICLFAPQFAVAARCKVEPKSCIYRLVDELSRVPAVGDVMTSAKTDSFLRFTDVSGTGKIWMYTEKGKRVIYTPAGAYKIDDNRLSCETDKNATIETAFEKTLENQVKEWKGTDPSVQRKIQKALNDYCCRTIPMVDKHASELGLKAVTELTKEWDLYYGDGGIK